ncbi:MAG: RND transporter [Peptococcaceae bacterium BICA1-8]|nr:MAG: RND transporter [Peptococcaceae bacterium BICA1-8]
MKKIVTKKKSIILLILIALVFITGFWFTKSNETETEEIQYEQVRISRGDIVVGLDSDGVVEFSKVNLRFGVKGAIAEILVNRGDQVEKGNIIAKLDDRDYQDQYQLALAKLKDAEEQELTNLLDDELKIGKLKAELENTKTTYQEMVEIPDAYSTNDIKLKKQDLDNKEIEYQNALKKHDILVTNFNNRGTQLNQNELAAKMAEEDLEDTILYAPVAGTILDLTKKAGESVSDEQDLVVLHENNDVKAITKVIEYDIGGIKLGQKVNVTVEALPDQTFVGEVSNIDALPTSDNSGLVSYNVEINIINPDEGIKDGMTSTLTFILKEVRDCLIVPYKAVKIVNRKQLVTVIDENGAEVEREIKTGFTDGISVEVLEGLEQNETIVYARGR